MFRFYSQTHEDAIQHAAENNNWDEVNKLYQSSERKDILDDAICEGVIKALSLKQLTPDVTKDYLLRALTLGPLTIKPILIERLRSLTTLNKTEHHGDFIAKLAETSADIYTVMLAQKCNYDIALTHVSQNLPIPRLEALTSLMSRLYSLKQ